MVYSKHLHSKILFLTFYAYFKIRKSIEWQCKISYQRAMLFSHYLQWVDLSPIRILYDPVRINFSQIMLYKIFIIFLLEI